MVFHLDQMAYELLGNFIGSNTAGFITRVKRHEHINCIIVDADQQPVKDTAIKIELYLQRSFYGEWLQTATNFDESAGKYRIYYNWSSRPLDYNNLTFIIRAVKESKVLGEMKYSVETHRYPREGEKTIKLQIA